MKRLELLPRINRQTTVLAQIHANLQLNNIAHAELLFHRHWRSERQASLHVIHAFIKKLLNKQQEQRALEWFNSIPEFSLKFDVHSFAICIHHFLHSNQAFKAQELLGQMDSAGLDKSQLFLDPLFRELEDRVLLEKILSCPAGQSDSLLLSALQDSSIPTVEEDPFTPAERLEMLKHKQQSLISTEAHGVSILNKTIDGIVHLDGMQKYNQQLWIEQRSYNAAVEHWESIQKQIPEDAKTNKRVPKDVLHSWHLDLAAEIKKAIEASEQSTSIENDPLRPFLKLLAPEQLSKITITEFLRAPSRRMQDGDRPTSGHQTEFGKIPALSMAKNIGTSVQREYNLQQLSLPENRRELNLQRGVHQLHTSGKLFSMTLRRVLGEYAKKQGKYASAWTPFWGIQVTIQIGSVLMGLFLKVAEIMVCTPDSRNSRKTIEEVVPAVKHEIQLKAGRRWGVLEYHPAMFELLASNPINVAPWCLPMVVPPLPWITWTSGGYLQYRSDAMRINHNIEHREFIRSADEANHLTYCLRALDILGATPWVINFNVYKVAAHYWNLGIQVPGIPSLHEPPPVPIPADLATNPESKRKYKAQCSARDRDIRNNFSNRCDVNYKLDIARAFLGETIYFPHNIDFRGRAYPMPPHLNHMGSDLCRGLLKFKEKKPLGERGLWWLKVQLSNLAGNDKASMEDRVKFTEEHLADIIDSARNPTDGRKWWMQSDSPWQLLATCIELDQALKLEDPTLYQSSLPIHQDGSCNGLQHYAALGGDYLGAKAVNLVPSEKPGDVYSGVAEGVQQRVDKDCEEGVPEALLMKDRINRKLVKQTVMTNTYGVTFIGAKAQVKNRLREARAANPDRTNALSDDQIEQCSKYITVKIFESMSDMFTGARELQIWLNTVAKLIAQSVDPDNIPEQALKDAMFLEQIGLLEGLPVISEGASLLDVVKEELSFSENSKSASDADDDADDGELKEKLKPKAKTNSTMQMTSVTWTTPLGLPIVQPYRRIATTEIKTHLQTFSVVDGEKPTPVNWQKQSSAFPPNFVHSLDASHMMLSCVACHSNDITFAAVHDSYWTHAATVDEMGKHLREAFVQLHSEQVMERLESEFKSRYGQMRIPTTVRITDEAKLKQWTEYLKLAKRPVRKVVKTWKRFELPPLPKRGDFDVKRVLDSRYFFH